jgi:integrase
MIKRRHRGANEGHISRRKDGRWEGKLSLGWRDGRRWRKSFYAASREEVARLLTKTLHDRDRGLPIVPERQTVAAFLERWLKESVEGRVAQTTLETYIQHCRLYLIPQLGRFKLAKLGPEQVQAFLNRQLKCLSPRTTQLSLITLRKALKSAQAGRALESGATQRRQAGRRAAHG